MISEKKLLELIDAEISWCKDEKNRVDSDVTEEQAEWFIDGLEQSKLIVGFLKEKGGLN